MTLEERLLALEQKVATLESDLRQVHAVSMKRHLRCSCGGGNIIRSEKVRAGNNGTYLSLHHGWLLSWGDIEAYTCLSCGLVELHALNLDRVKLEGEVTQYATEPALAEPPPDPYR